MKTPIDRYRQTIRYTDKFIGALHDRLDKSGLTENTIFIVVGDHGEAFGEHGILGHEQIGFEEGLRIPWIISAPSLISKPAKIDKPVTNADLTPTILSLMNFQIKQFNFDGLNAINAPEDRKLFFSGWLPESPAGYIHKNKKFVYLPNNKMLTAYDLNNDPNETKILELTDPQAGKIINEIVSWRKKTITKMQQKQSGETILFDNWHCSWKNRLAEADFEEKDK
jgi:arylsulfatase A-like enzyme